MDNTPFTLKFLWIFLLVCLSTSCSSAFSNESLTATGHFSILWGDKFTSPSNQSTRYFLNDEAGASVELFIDSTVAENASGILSLNGRMVVVTYTKSSSMLRSKTPLIEAEHIEPLDMSSDTARVEAAATGPQPWVTIMCKFSDESSEPKNLGYFSDMYSSSYPGLDHYWREASYNRVSISGSDAFGWFRLPQPRSYYVYDNNGDGSIDLDFDRITSDCTGTADAQIYFPDYVGINMMFNDDLDGYAWGGTQFINIDGKYQRYRVTWEPPWGYEDLTVIAHEMGHGFGMPHSSGNYGATYDNVWDVMSSAWANCNASRHPKYGCLGQQTIGYHRDLVGWLEADETFVFNGTTQSITLERLTKPASENYLYAIIPINDSTSHFYTVEVRKRVGYDIKLISNAVIIHEVNTTRSRPAYVVDIDNNGSTGDAGAIWEVGETFSDVKNNVCVKILSAEATSYNIQIGCQAQLPLSTMAPLTRVIHLLLH